MQFRVTATSNPIDLDALVGSIPELATRWRALPFDAGVAVVDGARTDGLAVTQGTHPWRGTQYRVLLPTPQSPKAPAAWLVDLLADDSAQIRFRVTDAELRQSVEVEVHTPSRPTRVEIAAAIEDRGGWLTRGILSLHVHADLTALHAGVPHEPQVRVDFRHNRVRGSLTIALDTSSQTQWTTSIEAFVRGRGLLRPVVALAAPFLQRLGRRELRRWAQGFPTQVDDFNRQTAESFGMPASPKKIAEVVLNDFLATLQRRPNVDTY